MPAAIAAEAADRQSKFWPMHDIIYDRQLELSRSAFVKFAEQLGLDVSLFKTHLHDHSMVEKIESHFESGIRSGVNGTPSFFINGRKYNGSYDFVYLYSELEGKVVNI